MLTVYFLYNFVLINLTVFSHKFTIFMGNLLIVNFNSHSCQCFTFKCIYLFL